MKKKNDLFINYDNSYRKRRRGRSNPHNKTGQILVVVFLAIGFGFISYYGVRIKTNIEYHKRNQSDSGNEGYMENLGIISAAETEELQVVNEKLDQMEAALEQQEETVPSAIYEEVEDNRTPTKVKGIYLTSAAAGSKKMNQLIDIVDTTEINTMVIDVKDDYGKISYTMDSPKAREIDATSNLIPDMETYITKLKQKEIYLIARIVAFKDPYLAEKRHDLAVKNKDGSLYRDNKGDCWINPYQKEVWDYLIEIASQAASIGFDEIQFDYIRFSTGGGMDKVDFGEGAESMTKEDIIIEFTKYAYEKLKPLEVFVSADVYGTIISSQIDAGLVGQNYIEMSKYLDYICPMIYPSHFGEGNYGIKHPDLEPYNIIRKVLIASKSKLEQIPEGEHRAVVRPWLQDFTASWLKHYMRYGGNELREQINGVYDAGYEEWLLWNAACNYSTDGLHKE